MLEWLRDWLLQRRIRRLLDRGGIWTAGDLARLFAAPPDRVLAALNKLVRAGEVIQTRRGFARRR